MEMETEPVEGEFVAVAVLRVGALYENTDVMLPSRFCTLTFDDTPTAEPAGTRQRVDESETHAVASHPVPP